LSLALLSEVAGRSIEGLIFFVAYKSLTQPISLYDAASIDLGRTFIDNATFFVPFQIGSREAGLSLLTEQIIGAGSEKILAATLLYRLVEILWIFAGYGLWIIFSNSSKSRI
jgi:hypothetical protein